MPNLLELIDKSKLIKSNFSAIISNIKADILSGKVKNKTEAFLRLRDEITTFIQSLTSPTMKLREAYRFPVSQDINDMIYEAYTDMNNLFKSVNDTNNILTAAFDKVSVERNVLTSISKYTGKRISEIESDISDMFSISKYKNFVEEFVSHDYIDKELLISYEASIDTLSGTMTLGRTSISNYDIPSIYLTKNCNGFPGDTHQATAANGSILYSGELDPHTNLEYVIDSERDTWFEYEAIKIEDTEYQKTDGYGFEYKEGISWLTQDNKLILELQVVYHAAHIINWLLIDPFLPVESTYIPGKIISVVLDDGKGVTTELITSPTDFRREMVLNFPMRTVKTITIRIEQPNSYRTMIGHNYYTEIEINRNLLEPITAEGNRTDGPKPSVELLGMRYEPSTGEYKQPYLSDSYTAPNTRELFKAPKSESNKTSGTELLNANRFQIGIRSIDAACIEFMEESGYVSVPFQFEEPVTRLKIEAEDQVPSTFGGVKSDWIKYLITTDNGQTWAEVDSGEEIAVAPVQNVRVGVLLKRPTDITRAKYQTPTVFKYVLRGRMV